MFAHGENPSAAFKSNEIEEVVFVVAVGGKKLFVVSVDETKVGGLQLFL